MRRRPVLTVLAVLALAGGGYALYRTLRVDPDPKGALVVTPNPIDFGVVPWLDVRRMTVEIRNRSDREVVLLDPHPDCTCISLSRPPDALHLPPGGRTTTEVLLYTPKTAPGRMRKTFTFVSDDPVVPRLDVPVLGLIEDYRSVQPREIALGLVDPSAEGAPHKVEVRGVNGWKVVLAEADSSDPRILVEVRPEEGGGDVLLRTAKGAAKGKVSAQVRLGLDVTGRDRATQRYAETVWVSGEIR